MQHWSGRGQTQFKVCNKKMGQYQSVKYDRLECQFDIEDIDSTHSRKSKYGGNFYKSCYHTICECMDWFVSGVIWLMLWAYRAVVGRYPTFLENNDRRVEKEVERLQNEKRVLKQQANSEFGTLQDTIKDKEQTLNLVQSTLDIEQQRYNVLKKEKDSLSVRVQSLIEERNALENEKQDARRRLSEQVSVKLRDNNPNIVDLSDQCRPTKLAEMFSELYDNEWINAFTDLEGCLGEEHAIVVLLDIVMGVYGFCEEMVTVPWNVLKEWFLDMNIPGAQQASKWLKYSCKANIKNKIPEVREEYAKIILDTCKGTELAKVLSEKDVTCYVTKCIELCLLMVTTDPPVVLKCPGWRGYANIGNDGSVQQLSQDNTLSTESKRDKDLFDRDLFKEYTTRGKYIDYIVWPALLLYEDGPLLSKGIAQGSAEQCRDTELMMWTWCGENINI